MPPSAALQKGPHKPRNADLPKLWTTLHARPVSVSGAAVYMPKKDLMEVGERESKYPDENGNKTFNLFRTVGTGFHQRVWVPRNMAPELVDDQRVRGKDVDFPCTFKPRNEEQGRCIGEVVDLLQQEESFIFQAPPGFGKTWCAIDIIAKIKKKTIVVVTKQDILDQWVAAIEALTPLRKGPGKGIGIIQGDVCDTVGQTIVIAMVHSLAKEARYPEFHFRDFGLAIWDECHRIAADFFSQSCFRVPALLRLGISATPKRKDGREEVLHAHLGHVRVVTTLAPMTPRVIRRDSPWECPKKAKVDAKTGKVVMGKDDKVVYTTIPHTAGRTGTIERMMANHHGRNRMLADFIKQAVTAGRKVIFQSTRLDHLETMTSLLVSLGIAPALITQYVGGLSEKQRTAAKLGQVIMATYKMTSEATDIPEIDTLVMGIPLSDVEQVIGRCTRFLEGKKEPLIFDPIDKTSPVFAGYAVSRLDHYRSIGAKIQ